MFIGKNENTFAQFLQFKHSYKSLYLFLSGVSSFSTYSEFFGRFFFRFRLFGAILRENRVTLCDFDIVGGGARFGRFLVIFGVLLRWEHPDILRYSYKLSWVHPDWSLSVLKESYECAERFFSGIPSFSTV